MASINDISKISEDIEDKLSLNSDEQTQNTDSDLSQGFETHLSGFETRELYKIALNFYKGE